MNHHYNTSFNQWQKKSKPSGYNFHKSLKISFKKFFKTNIFKIVLTLSFLTIIVPELGIRIQIFFKTIHSIIFIIYTFLCSSGNTAYITIVSIKNFFFNFFSLERALEIFCTTIIWRWSNKFINLLEKKLKDLFKTFLKK